MTQNKLAMAGAGDTIGHPVGDLRKELGQIRSEATKKEGLEALRLRLEAVEVEAQLLDMYIALVSKSVEGMVKLAAS